MIAIEKGVPMPPKSRQIASRAPRTPGRYSLRRMEVGDSFLVKAAPGESLDIVRNRLNVAVFGLKKRDKATAWKFTIRTVSKGVRVWRVQ